MTERESDNVYAAPEAAGTESVPTPTDVDTAPRRRLSPFSRQHGARSAPSDVGSTPRPSFSLFAVVVGFMVDLGLTFVVSQGLDRWTFAHFSDPEALLAFWEGPQHRLLFLPFGAACSVVGGFVTGWLARQRESLHGLGNVALSLGYFLWLDRTGSIDVTESPALTLLEHACIVAAILSGCALARRRRLRRAEARTPHA